MSRPVAALLIAVVAFGVLARRTFVVVRVQGASMLPTYADGDRLLAMRRPLLRRVSPGDVVVVRASNPSGLPELLVKRVERVEPGDHNGGRVFVAGDNPPSYDSLVFGPVPLSHVVGRVITVVSSS